MIRQGPDWRRWQLEAGEDFFREHRFVFRRGDEVFEILVEERTYDGAGSPYRARVSKATDARANAALGEGDSLETALDRVIAGLE